MPVHELIELNKHAVGKVELEKPRQRKLQCNIWLLLEEVVELGYRMRSFTLVLYWKRLGTLKHQGMIIPADLYVCSSFPTSLYKLSYTSCLESFLINFLYPLIPLPVLLLTEQYISKYLYMESWKHWFLTSYSGCAGEVH